VAADLTNYHEPALRNRLPTAIMKLDGDPMASSLHCGPLGEAHELTIDKHQISIHFVRRECHRVRKILSAVSPEAHYSI
jgi:hypothetical protein